MFVPRSIEDVLEEVRATGKFSIRKKSHPKEPSSEKGGGIACVLARIAALQESMEGITKNNVKVKSL
jgi:hypothetical protein